MKFSQAAAFAILTLCQPVIADEAQPLICTDLFKAACTDAKGKLKDRGQTDKRQKDIVKMINDSRDYASQQLGYKSFEQAVKKKISDAGIELNKDISPEKWAIYSGILTVDGVGSTSGTEIYPAVKRCIEKQKSITSRSGKLKLGEKGAIERLKKYILEIKELEAETDDLIIQARSRDLSKFYSEYIHEPCAKLKTQKDKSKFSKQIVETCENVQGVRQQIVELYRSGEDPNTNAALKKFVRKYYYKQTEAPEIKNGASELERQTAIALAAISGINCSDLGAALNYAATAELSEFAVDLQISQPFIENLLNKIYTPERKAIMTEAVAEAKKEIDEIIDQVNFGSKEKIRKGYQSLSFLWVEPPAASEYVDGDNGIKILDKYKSTGNVDDYYVMFADRSLGAFTRPEARYKLDEVVGELKNKERVHVGPFFIYDLNEKNPFTELVTYHELGHKLGKKMAWLNGHEIKEEYLDLFKCFKKGRSINMTKDQVEEVVGDYFAAEILARRAANFHSQGERIQYLLQASRSYCVLEDSNTGIGHLDPKEEHPPYQLRLSGVIGANPNLRKTIGCEGESPKYQSCGLDKIKSPAVLNPHPVKPQIDRSERVTE